MSKQKVYKYELHPGVMTEIRITGKSAFLCVKNQNEKAVAYFLLTEDHGDPFMAQTYKFFTKPTGEEFELTEDEKHNAYYVDTLMFDAGRFVLHVFRLMAPYVIPFSPANLDQLKDEWEKDGPMEVIDDDGPDPDDPFPY